MASLLDEFVAGHLQRPWQPGQVDCMLAVADWCVRMGYPDPAASYRGTYDTEARTQAIVASLGGLIPWGRKHFGEIGAKIVTEPSHGCVAVVGSRNNIQRQWGAIYDGSAKGWRVRFIDAYPVVKARPLIIWKL
jgi:hypothetical protein